MESKSSKCVEDLLTRVSYLEDLLAKLTKRFDDHMTMCSQSELVTCGLDRPDFERLGDQCPNSNGTVRFEDHGKMVPVAQEPHNKLTGPDQTDLSVYDDDEIRADSADHSCGTCCGTELAPLFRSFVFSNADLLDNIMSHISFEDSKIMQLVCKDVNSIVISHRPTLSKRRIVISKKSVTDIALKPPMVLWTNARIKYNVPLAELNLLSFLWPTLEDLHISHCKWDWCKYKNKIKELSPILFRTILPSCNNLTRLAIGIDMFIENDNIVQEVSNLKSLWSRLVHFEIIGVSEYLYNNRAFRLSQKLCFKQLSSFNWNIQTLKMSEMNKTAKHIFSSTFVQNLRHIEFAIWNTDQFDFWDQLIVMPMLTSVTVKIMADENYDLEWECLKFSSFLQQQPLLSSLKIVPEDEEHIFDDSFQCPRALVEAIASRGSQLKHFHFGFSPLKKENRRVPFPFSFLSELTNLRSFIWNSITVHDSGSPRPSAKELIDSLPDTLIHLNDISITLHVCDKFPFVMNPEEDKARAFTKFPCLKYCEIETDDTCTYCKVCRHDSNSESEYDSDTLDSDDI